MKLKLTFDSLRETKPHEYVSRFIFGGAVTVAAGLISEHYGPVVGGLFLAFPGIFPAGISLVEKHNASASRTKERLVFFRHVVKPALKLPGPQSEQ
jgi:hypothetical protein